MATLGLFSSCDERGCSLVAVHGGLIAVASLQITGRRRGSFGSCGLWALECVGFSSCGTQA